MALASVLGSLCPSFAATSFEALPPGEDANQLELLPSCGGPPIRCHAGLMRARCPELPPGAAVEVPAPADVVFILLRWVYAEEVGQVAEQDISKIAAVVRLSKLWGLRDAGSLQGRLAAGRTDVRGAGCLAEDLLRAYDGAALDTHLVFQAVGDEGQEQGPPLPLHAGMCALLRGRCSYFRAMLGGGWAESALPRESGCTPVISVHWPHQQLAQLLRFVHGGVFVAGLADLAPAVACADFFGVPSLHAVANDWVASHLGLESLAELWNWVEEEPSLAGETAGHEDTDSADAACFDFAVRHFLGLALPPLGGVGGDMEGEELPRWTAEDVARCGEMGDGPEGVPPLLHVLKPSLLRRVLASGLVDMPSEQLIGVVCRYAKAHAGSPSEFQRLVQSLQPPAVLFNAERRRQLVPRGGMTIRSFM